MLELHAGLLREQHGRQVIDGAHTGRSDLKRLLGAFISAISSATLRTVTLGCMIRSAGAEADQANRRKILARVVADIGEHVRPVASVEV